MRKIGDVSIICLLAASGFLFGHAVALSEGDSAQPVPRDTAFSWSPPATNTDGSPVTDLAGYRFSVAAATANLPAGEPALRTVVMTVAEVECSANRCRGLPAGLLAGLPDGEYRVWLQAFDTAGNVSPYSEPTVILRPDQVSPRPPTDITVELPAILTLRVNIDIQPAGTSR